MNNYSNNYQIVLHFVKTNLKLLLRLVSTDIHNDEVSLTANEFNSLRILFKVRNMAEVAKPAQNLSQLTPFYTQQSGQSIKIHMNVLQEWLLGSVAQMEEDLGASQSRNFSSQLQLA